MHRNSLSWRAVRLERESALADCLRIVRLTEDIPFRARETFAVFRDALVEFQSESVPLVV